MLYIESSECQFQEICLLMLSFHALKDEMVAKEGRRSYLSWLGQTSEPFNQTLILYLFNPLHIS